tara:strand:- start:3044 stop:3403 length:360 start_codon:yes stop_codon:yes gene_type:complete
MLLSGYVQLCYASCDDETSDGEDTSRVRYIVGISIALLSAVMYLLSRMPQLYKNFSRKSTDGLSIIMFIMSILGNFMYGKFLVGVVAKQNEGYALVGSASAIRLRAYIPIPVFSTSIRM